MSFALVLSFTLLLHANTSQDDEHPINTNFVEKFLDVSMMQKGSTARQDHTPGSPVKSLSTQVADPGTTYEKPFPGCHGLVDTSSCDQQRERARAACPEEFVSQHFTRVTYESATGRELSRIYVPGYCPSETETLSAPVVTLTAEDFQRLPLKGSGIKIDPIVDMYYVKLPIFFYSNSTPQTLTTEILGTGVLVEATPSSYVWDYGNGESSGPVLPTGRPAWSGKAEYTYKKSAYYDITLTTSWTGQYSTDAGMTWQMISGTATTIDVYEQLPVAQSIPLLVKPDPDAVFTPVP